MQFNLFIKYLFVMAAVTYLVRMLPLVMVRKQFQNRFIKSFLSYIPYAVLTAMTIPDIFSSTGNALSAWLGFAAAIILSFLGKSLINVAAFACIVSLIASLLQ